MPLQFFAAKSSPPHCYLVAQPFPEPITLPKAPSSHVSEPALCRTRSNGASPPRSSAPPLAKPGQSPDFSRTGKNGLPSGYGVFGKVPNPHTTPPAPPPPSRASGKPPNAQTLPPAIGKKRACGHKIEKICAVR